MMGGLGRPQVKYALPIGDLSQPMNRLPATAWPAFLPDGRHLIYVRGDCGPHTDTFKLPEDVLKKQALDTLQRWFPAFDERQIEAVHITRDSHAEPITLLGQLSRRLPTRIANTRALLCTSAQAYPRRVGWDADVTLARETAAAIRPEPFSPRRMELLGLLASALAGNKAGRVVWLTDGLGHDDSPAESLGARRFALRRGRGTGRGVAALALRLFLGALFLGLRRRRTLGPLCFGGRARFRLFRLGVFLIVRHRSFPRTSSQSEPCGRPRAP